MSKTADAEKSVARAAKKSAVKSGAKSSQKKGEASKAAAASPGEDVPAKARAGVAPKAAAPKAAPKKAAAPKPAKAPAAKLTATKAPAVRPTPRIQDAPIVRPAVVEPPVVERMTTTGRTMVTGPIDSKRFGRTLVVDISAPQIALTARRGTSIPRASLIVTTAAREIINLAREGVKVDTIVVVGSDGDPSRHPDLREITENLRALRDKHLSRSKLRVITTTRDLGSYDLRATLAMYDRVHLQFEWGTAKVFSAVTGEKPAVLTSLMKLAGSFDHLVVEANFFKGPTDKDNSTDAEVKHWIKKLQELKPQEVHILPGAGSGAQVPRSKPVAKARRDEIAEEVTEKTGLNVSVFEDEPALV